MSEIITANGNGHDPDIKRFVGDFGPRERASVSKAAIPQTRAELGGVSAYEELGRTGLRHWGGFVFEEWLRELQQGRRAAEVFREMQDSDAVIGSIMYAIQMLIRRTSWWAEPKGSQEAEWLEGMLHDMSTSWADTIGEIISFLGYGYSYHELNFKLRKGTTRNPQTNSKFNDGQIGLANMPIRSQDSLWKWVFDDDGSIRGMIQNPPPDYLLRFIPIEKAAHFRTTMFKDNPEGRSILRNAYRCFSADTELLTESGWKLVSDLVPEDSLATMDDLGLLEYQKPSHLHSYDYDGDLVQVRGRYLDQLVTPNHRMWVKPAAAACGYRFVEASQLKPSHRFNTSVEWLAPDVDSHTIPEWVGGNGQRWPAHVVPMDDWLRFLGIYLAEGHAGHYGHCRMVGVTQSQASSKYATVRSYVEQLGFPVFHHRNGTEMTCFEITRGQMYEHLAPLGNAHSKRVPDYVKRLSRRQLRIFLDAYHLGDGSHEGHEKKNRTMFTVNRLLADDLQECALKAGYCSSIRWRQASGFKPGAGVWVVNMGRTYPRGNRATSRTAVRYSGKVYCPTVPNGRVLCRRNGRVSWSGNSWYFKRNLENIEGIGVERDLAGLPVLSPPEGVDIWDADDPAMASVRQQAQSIVSSIRRDEQEGVILPFGWELELLSTGGRRQFDTNAIIGRYDNRIATSVLADMVLMGQDKVGSYALAVTKKDLFAGSLEAYLDIISSVFATQVIPRLWRLNGFTMPQPTLKHGSIETIDLDTLSNFVMRVAGAGGPFEWETIMPYLIDQAGMPQPSPDFDYEAAMAQAQIRGPETAQQQVKQSDPVKSRNVGRSAMGAGRTAG